MAEAHEAVAFQFAVKEDGIHLEFNARALKELLFIFFKSYLRRYRKIRNSILQGAYPSHTGHFVIIIISLLLLRYSVYNEYPMWPYSLLYQYLPFSDLTKDLLFILVTSIILWTILATCLQYILKLLLMYQGWMFINRKAKPSLVIKLWSISIKFLCYQSKELLYSYQRSLPKLFVPPLKSTLQRYTDSMQPLQTPEQFEKTLELAAEFEKGVGRLLQRNLVIKSYFCQNYVTEWWEKYVYLAGGRRPKELTENCSPFPGIMINSNYYCLDQIIFRTIRKQSAKAASLSHAIFEWKSVLETERCAPIKLSNLVPLCSWQYERLFGTCRIPHKQIDELKHVHGRKSRHVVALRNGKYYKIDFFKKGKLLHQKQIEKCIQEILDDTSTASLAEQHLASFTALDRDEWADFREKYLLSGKNKRSLETIEQAAFFLVLDNKAATYGKLPDHILPNDLKNCEKNQFNDSLASQPKDYFSEYCASTLHGGGGDRWFDKNFNLVIFENGLAGLCVEHSFGDAPILGHLYEATSAIESDYFHYEQHEKPVANKRLLMQPSIAQMKQFRYNSDGTLNGDNNLPACNYERLEWTFDQEAADRIEVQHIECLKSIDSVDLKVKFFEDFGEDGIKKIKCSPDSFLQMALQLTYYMNQNKFNLTYESAMTRLFREGRTDTIRPITPESCAFVMAMLEEPIDIVKTYELLQNAMTKHGRLAREAMVGKAVDRHLFCLYVISKGLNKQSPFLDDFINNEWRLSTSQTPTNQTSLNLRAHPEVISGGGGFGPVTKHGYGVSYIFLKLDILVIHVCSFKDSKLTDSQTFIDQIFQSLRSMHEVCKLALELAEESTDILPNIDNAQYKHPKLRRDRFRSMNDSICHPKEVDQ